MTDHILITCPATNLPVKTGYRAPRGSAIDGLKHMRLRHCPRCEQEHHWDGCDGFWSEAPPEPARRGGLRHLLLGVRERIGQEDG